MNHQDLAKLVKGNDNQRGPEHDAYLHICLMPEMTHARKDHSETGLICGLNDFVVSH